eukprot:UN18536
MESPIISNHNRNQHAKFLKFIDDYIITTNNVLTPEQILSIYGFNEMGPSNFTSVPNGESISLIDVLRQQVAHYPENVWSNMGSQALMDIFNMFEWGDNKSLISRDDAGYIAIGIRIFYLLHNTVVVYSCFLDD